MEITPSVHALYHPFTIPVTPELILNRFVYSYLIFGDTITLIDTGVAGSDARIFDYIRSQGCNPSDIEQIILTHSHPDHIGAAMAIQQETGCKIISHPAECAWIEDVSLQNHERAVPGFFTLVSGSVHVDQEIQDGDTVLLDPSQDRFLEVLHTPGHSPGSVSLLLPGTGVLFSGDAIPIPGEIPVYDDALASFQTLKRLMDLPGVRFLLSSWDVPRDGERAYTQMYQASEYIQKIHDVVRQAGSDGDQSLMEITRRVAASLGLPPLAVTPLLARTCAAHLQIASLFD